MERLRVPLDESSYRIEIRPGLIEEIGGRVTKKLDAENIVVVTDENVRELYGETLLGSFGKVGVDPLVVSVPPGEGSKSLDRAEGIYSQMSENGIDRVSGLVAFGGGVVGDLGGFVASTYMRGIPYVQLPTTLLAQVDSSVGGKTAVNLPEGKNLVGSFYQPRYVGIDPSVLETLPETELRSGLGEIIKSGLLRSEELFRRAVAYSSPSGGSIEPERAVSMIKESLEIKAGVVSKDRKDRGIRRILNLGHTIGHGLEASGGFEDLTHGEAVLWGLVGELEISGRRGLLSSKRVEALTDHIMETGIPPLDTETGLDSLLGYIGRDKKVRDGKINCVLLEEVGAEARVEEVSKKEVRAALRYLDELNGGNLL